MQFVSVEHCTTNPVQYKYCSEDICVSVESLCPCLEGEFQCYQGDCISLVDTCDGLPHCLYGEDESEFICAGRVTEGTDKMVLAVHHRSGGVTETEDEMSLPVIVTISSVCVFMIVLMIICIGLFIAKRQKNNTSRESQSASEPLRKSYITTYAESAEDTHPQKRTTFHRGNNVTSRDHVTYSPVDGNDEITKDDNNRVIEVIETETDFEGNSNKPNLAIQSGVEIYDVNSHDSSKVYGLGKYTFKPRLKYLNSKPYDELDEKDRDKLYVINSYRHCSGKSIIPSTLTFDKDPQQFSHKFATELLCSSTPRPPLRGLSSIDKQCVSRDSIPATIQTEDA